MHRKKKRQALPLSKHFNKNDKKKNHRRTLTWLCSNGAKK
jgi:hypothetical protein